MIEEFLKLILFSLIMSFKRKFVHLGGIILHTIFPERIYERIVKIKIQLFGRPYIPGETSKAKARRIREGFFDKYIQDKGLDIGYGGDIISPKSIGFDFEDGDAETLEGLNKTKQFNFVYSSHTLEHMPNPSKALRTWWEHVKKNGFLILYIPHRDLFEKRKKLPSQWNKGHFNFFMPENNESPDTLGLKELIINNLNDYKIEYIKVCDEGYKNFGENKHSLGEYSIEAVIKKIS